MKNNHTLGIVLSGGGMRGLAHIGLLKALRENGIEPQFISGTSAGAIVGAMYARGYSEEDMLEFFKQISLFSWSFFIWSKPGLMDSELFQPYLDEYFPNNDFATLSKPLFITATDIVNGNCQIFSKGELIRPLMASAALPPFFSPVEIGDVLYVDGGIMNIFPVEALLHHCEHIIGSFVNPIRRIEENHLKTTRRVTKRALELRFYCDSKNKFRHCDYVFEPRPLNKIGLFDQKSMEKAYQIGYESALEEMDDIRAALGLTKSEDRSSKKKESVIDSN